MLKREWFINKNLRLCLPFEQDFSNSVASLIFRFPECVIVSEKQHESFSTEDDIDDEGKIKIKIQTKENHSKQEYLICKVCNRFKSFITFYCNSFFISIHVLKWLSLISTFLPSKI